MHVYGWVGPPLLYYKDAIVVSIESNPLLTFSKISLAQTYSIEPQVTSCDQLHHTIYGVKQYIQRVVVYTKGNSKHTQHKVMYSNSVLGECS